MCEHVYIYELDLFIKKIYIILGTYYNLYS